MSPSEKNPGKNPEFKTRTSESEGDVGIKEEDFANRARVLQLLHRLLLDSENNAVFSANADLYFDPSGSIAIFPSEPRRLTAQVPFRTASKARY